MPTIRQLRAELDRISAISGEDSLIAYSIWSEPVIRETVYGIPNKYWYPGRAPNATPEQFTEIVEAFQSSDDGACGLTYDGLKDSIQQVCFPESD